MPETIRELITTDTGTEGSKLIVKTIYDTLWDAVEKAKISRELAAIYFGPKDIPGSSIDVDLVTADSMAVSLVSEGAPFIIRTEEYTSFNMKPKKYGVAPKITREMIEDGKFPLLEHNIKTAGKEIAENETALIISNALDSAANTVSGSSAITIANITRAMQYLEDNDYEATDFLFGPEIANDMRNIDTFVEADKLGSREMLEKGYLGTIYGMRCWKISGSLITSSYAYVIDRNQAFVIAEKRPVTIEGYDDVLHDMSGAVISQRIACSALRTKAIAKITT